MIILFFSLFGVFDAAMDKLLFHYEKSRFASFNNQIFWNPKISWRNKWKGGRKENGERFLFSSTILVFTTDGWHLMKFFRNISLLCIAIFASLGDNFWQTLYSILVGRVMLGIIFELMFSKILSKN